MFWRGRPNIASARTRERPAARWGWKLDLGGSREGGCRFVDRWFCWRPCLRGLLLRPLPSSSPVICLAVGAGGLVGDGIREWPAPLADSRVEIFGALWWYTFYGGSDNERYNRPRARCHPLLAKETNCAFGFFVVCGHPLHGRSGILSVIADSGELFRAFEQMQHRLSRSPLRSRCFQSYSVLFEAFHGC